MKDLRRPAILFLLPMTLLANCAHLVQKREDYKVSSREPIVNGARLTAEMITTEGRANYSISAMVYFVAGETETGPYKCLLTAWGDRSSHKSMTVEKLDFRTASGQTASASRSKEIRFAAGSGGQGMASHVSSARPPHPRLCQGRRSRHRCTSRCSHQTPNDSPRYQTHTLLNKIPGGEVRHPSLMVFARNSEVHTSFAVLKGSFDNFRTPSCA